MSWNSRSASGPLTSSHNGGREAGAQGANLRGADRACGGRGTDPPGLCHLGLAGLQARTRPGGPPSPAETTHRSQGWDKGHSGLDTSVEDLATCHPA